MSAAQIIDQDTGLIVSDDHALVPLSEVESFLATRPPVETAKELRDRLSALCAYYRGKVDVYNELYEGQIRTERYIGQVLTELPKNTGNRYGPDTMSGPDAPTLNDLGFTYKQSSRLQQLAAVPEEQFNGYIAAKKEATERIVKADLLNRDTHTMRVMGSSESPEWYTPGHIVDLVLQFFEIITVDPCSNSHEHPNVPASILYTKDDDGLTRPWCGNVYMNPPYGDEIDAWVNRLVDLYRAGDIDQAIALLPGRIDTQWFQPLYDYPICNVRGRIKFQNSDNSAPFPSVIVYLGADQEGFIEAFKHLGPVVKRIA